MSSSPPLLLPLSPDDDILAHFPAEEAELQRAITVRLKPRPKKPLPIHEQQEQQQKQHHDQQRPGIEQNTTAVDAYGLNKASNKKQEKSNQGHHIETAKRKNENAKANLEDRSLGIKGMLEELVGEYAKQGKQDPHDADKNPLDHKITGDGDRPSTSSSLNILQEDAYPPRRPERDTLEFDRSTIRTKRSNHTEQKSSSKLSKFIYRGAELRTTSITDHSSINPRSFKQIASLLKARAHQTPKAPCIIAVDNKAKDSATMTYEMLSTRAERIAQIIKSKALPVKAKIALVYKRTEMNDFAAALFGCYFASVTAVPIVPPGTNNDLDELKYIVEHAEVSAILTSDADLKILTKELSAKSIELPAHIIWIKTNDLGNFQSKKKGLDELIQVDEHSEANISYIRERLGDNINGVMISHEVIMNQCEILRTSHSIAPGTTIINTMESRQGLGLWLSLMTAIYCGCQCYDVNLTTLESPMHLLVLTTRTEASLLSVEQYDLRKIVEVACDILNDSRSKLKLDLSKLKTILINAASLQPRVSENLMTQTLQLLEFYGLDSAAIVPIASLPEAGGFILSMRSSDAAQASSLDNMSVTIDSEALTHNEIKPLGNEKANNSRIKNITLCDSGGLVPRSQMIIVDADTYLPCDPLAVGEIIVNGEHIPNQIWKQQNSIGLQLEGLEDQFWYRTGLLGFVYRERLFVIGALTDRFLIRNQSSRLCVHYAHDIVQTIETKLRAVKTCAPFSLVFNEEEVLVVIAEVNPKSDNAEATSGLIAALLYEIHGLEVYSIIICQVGTIPRTKENFVNIEKLYQAYFAGVLRPLSLSCTNPRKAMENANPKPSGSIQQGQFFVNGDLELTNNNAATSDKTPPAQNVLSLLKLRAEKQASGIAVTLLDAKGREAKSWTYEKMAIKVLSLARFFVDKKSVQKGDIVLILMPNCPDFVFTIYACMQAGLIPIIMPPVDLSKFKDEFPLLVDIIEQHSVKLILITPEHEDALKSRGAIAMARNREKATNGLFKMPPIYTVGKVVKNPMPFNIDLEPNETALLMMSSFMDTKYKILRLTNAALMAQCSLYSDLCQDTLGRPTLTTTNTSYGLGFFISVFHSILAGVTSIMIYPSDYRNNAGLWIEAVDHMKIKDVFATCSILKRVASWQLEAAQTKPFSMHNVVNLVVPVYGRPPLDLLRSSMKVLATNRLPDTAMSLVYANAINACITSQIYAPKHPSIWINSRSLKHDIVEIVDENSGNALELTDCGYPSPKTVIAIMRSSTQPAGYHQVGEIWTSNPGNCDGFSGPDQVHQSETFGYTIPHPGPGNLQFTRNGDVGFLYKPPGSPVSLLYVTGSPNECFVHEGIRFYCIDIEESVAGSHKSLKLEGCMLIQDNDTILLFIESANEAENLNIIPLITAALLEDHDFLPDSILFVLPNTLPRTLYADKRRLATRVQWSESKIVPYYTFRVSK